MIMNADSISSQKWFGCALVRSAVCLSLLLMANASLLAQERPTTSPSGRISIQQVQVAFIASGSLGGGTLSYKGHSYPIKIGGLGVGGVGASRLSATGTVYGLNQLSDFPGAYAEIRTGWALGDRGKGRIWLRNNKGVVISLQGKRAGLQLALGAEGVLMQLE
jgi:hypothetical protein